MQDLINEIRKLIEYAGQNGTIDKKSIDLLSIKQIESVIFDLTDNLGKKATKEALVVLKNLLDSKEPIQKILITLYNHFKKLYIVKLAEKYNRNLAEAMMLKPTQMFLVNKYKAQASLFQEKELKKMKKISLLPSVMEEITVTKELLEKCEDDLTLEVTSWN